MTIPNILGGLRFLLAFALLGIALSGFKTVFVVVLMVALFLDAVDGPIARYLHQASVQGSRLDTVADFSVYAVLVVSVWLLWPEIFLREIVYISLAALSMLLPFLVALIKFKTFTSYHTWLVKFATVCIAIGSFVLVLGGPALPFQLASLVSIIGGMEQILITLVLPGPRSDVKHLLAVLEQRGQI